MYSINIATKQQQTKQEGTDMFKVVVDGKEIGRYARVSYAKKQADLELELGGFSCDIYRGNKLYAYRRWNTEWR